MRADNRRGRHPRAARARLPPHGRRAKVRRLRRAHSLGLFGAALLYGDGIITPAISVLGAVEGLEVATHAARAARRADHASCILVVLFVVQQRGTDGIGKVFGPVMLVWFVAHRRRSALADHRARPGVLARAQSRPRACASSARNGWHGFFVLGSVVLVVTGGEALYADMGHFGARPIRIAWFTVVLPGAAAQLLRPGRARCCATRSARRTRSTASCRRPCSTRSWRSRPSAAVIASQALISGAFSLTQQAVQLGYSPRVKVDAHLASTRPARSTSPR